MVYQVDRQTDRQTPAPLRGWTATFTLKRGSRTRPRPLSSEAQVQKLQHRANCTHSRRGDWSFSEEQTQLSFLLSSIFSCIFGFPSVFWKCCFFPGTSPAGGNKHAASPRFPLDSPSPTCLELPLILNHSVSLLPQQSHWPALGIQMREESGAENKNAPRWALREPGPLGAPGQGGEH